MAAGTRDSRAAIAYWSEVFGCATDVMARGGSAGEYLACRLGGE
jgi:hypothetical protein